MNLRDPRVYRFAVLALLAVHAALIVGVARVEPWVVDEPTYFKAGLALRRYLDWTVPQTIHQGPLPYWANQLAAALGLAPADSFSNYLFWGRLGTLPFALLGAGLLARLTRLAWGPTAAIGALALHALNPVIIANASLMTCDVAIAGLYLAVVYVLWRYLTAPSTARLGLLGVTLGAALATKYFALFLVPIMALVAGLETLRGFRPGLLWSRRRSNLGARLADLIPASLLCGAVALLTLHTCYLWAVDGYTVRTPPAGAALDPRDPNAGPVSRTLRALLDVPGAPTALHLLPDPFVRGIDFQQEVQSAGLTVLGEQRVSGHPAFYLVSFAVKLPLALLVLGLLGLFVRRPPLPPRLAILLTAAVVLPFAYLSLAATQQMGIRYALPLLPFVSLFGGRGVHWLLQGPRRRPGLIVVALCALSLAAFHLRHWPFYTSAFNPLAGDRPYLLFTVGTDLGWPGEERIPSALRARHANAARVGGADGPRLGECIVYGPELGAVDPRDPSRVHHWLRRFAPADRLGAWFVFDVSEQDFRRAVGADSEDADARGMVELAIALLGAGEPERARACLQGNDDPDAGQVRSAIALAADPDNIDGYASALITLGRTDLVVAMGSRVSPAILAQAFFARSAFAEAIEVLERVATSRRLSAPEVFGLMLAYRRTGQRQEALEALERHMPAPDDPQYALFVREREQMEIDLQRRARHPDIEAALRR